MRHSADQIHQISLRLEGMKKCIPSTFARKPRPLTDVDWWKATEYRQFLLYTGKIALHRILRQDSYDHFMTLSVALSILVSPELAQTHRGYANELLVHFVSQGRKLYGNEFLVYNVHSLLHLADEVKEHGYLDACSAFPFENYMHELKKLVRSGRRPMAQIVKRLSERSTKPELAVKGNPTVSTKSPNNAFVLPNHSCCEVIHAVNMPEDSFMCRVYEHSEAVFTEPCDSRIIGVYSVHRRNAHMRVVSAERLTMRAIRMYVVVEFLSERGAVSVVPVIWTGTEAEGHFCYWPPGSVASCSSRVRQCEQPDKQCWKRVPVRIFANTFTDEDDELPTPKKRMKEDYVVPMPNPPVFDGATTSSRRSSANRIRQSTLGSQRTRQSRSPTPPRQSTSGIRPGTGIDDHGLTVSSVASKVDKIIIAIISHLFLVSGVTLWDAEAVNKHIDVHQQPKTHLKFTASDTLSEKAKLLDINASLKASFFSGLVEVGGSAKYLNDTKSSTHQSRVTMQYSQTTEFKQLTMKNLGNITYPQVFDQKTATHVVTAVLYGAQAFMVFDHTAAENECKQVVEGNLHAVVKKIPTISIEGEASLKMTEEEKTLSENISVTFYGDVALEENPTTYKEALEVYKKLPTLMKKENYKGGPLTVWLYPLMLLDDKAARLMREISMDLVNKTENLLEEFGEVERRCNDLFKNQMTDDFSDVKDMLLKFGDLHSCYKTMFQKALSRVLPAIRGGTQEGKALEDILNFHGTSPFNARNVNKWLDNITTELNILSSYTSGLKNLTVVNSPVTLCSILFDPENDVVVCLSFTSLKYEDSYLAALQDFKSSEGFRKFEQTSERIFSCQSMRQILSLFTSFSKANKNEKGIKFITASISDPSNPGNSIRLYQKGRLTDPKFQPVSKPPLPVVETSDGKMILKLSKSPTGKTVQFRVEYRITPPTDSAEDADEWTVTDTSDAQPSFTLTGLKPANQYWVQYRAVSDVGVSEASDSVSFTFHGNLEVTRIPYIDTIPGGLKAEMAFFTINLQIKPHDVAFHLEFRIGDSVVRNSFRNGKWENEERTSWCPVSKGSAFDIFVVTKAEGYEVQ
ncbi:uncharacterized protein LOC132865788 [Neoarius graeffei]|uniref:uncharacterized protein LOC132865788 n=1 Tax=Neoarius graeffei TaxID=443677 RepID=UPI00298C260A|nr:uncharacterized protein LOC132865788 [Neoarius graeffei]